MRPIDETELVGFLEAVYALDLEDDEWLKEALHALLRLCGPELRYLGFFYDASDEGNFKIWNLTRAQGVLPELEPSWEVFRSLCDAPFVRSTFRRLFLGSARRTAAPYLNPVLADREKHGWGDFFFLNGLDSSGVGCLLTLGCRESVFEVSDEEAAMFRRLAGHLAAAFRCRRRLAPTRTRRSNGRADAVFETDGRLLHAERSVRTERKWLAGKALELEAAHVKRKRREGIRVLDLWRPISTARWTLVESFEENGRRYIVARQNQAEARSFSDLTDRERQIVVHASLGMSNKQIAVALGISDATVRVLMARAAKRFGVRSRKELLSHPVLSAARP